MDSAQRVVVGQETEIDWISEPRRLVDFIPKWEDLFTGVQDLRSLQEEAAKVNSARRAVGMTAGGTMMRVACFPEPLRVAIHEINPHFFQDKAGFYRWLEAHPEYRVGRTVVY